jgi:CBS domain containing-hemolysin-like protein
LHWFYCLSYPLVWALNQTSLWLLRRLGIESVDEAGHAHSEEELRLIITALRPEPGGSAAGRNLALNALSLRQRVAREVMRPRQEIVCLNTQANLAECLDVAEKTRF